MYKAGEVLNDIYMILAERNSLKAADALVHPLVWYYATGRMSLDEERALKRLDRRQKLIVAKKLEKGGSDYEAALRVVKYLDRFKAA